MFLLLLRRTRRSSEKMKLSTQLFCKQLEEMEPRVPASHTWRGKILLVMDNARPHPAKAEKPRDGVPTPSTLFSGLLYVRFPCISRLGKLLSRTSLREPQVRGVRNADLDRDQASRLPAKRTRTTARMMDNNRENTRIVLRRP